MELNYDDDDGRQPENGGGFMQGIDEQYNEDMQSDMDVSDSADSRHIKTQPKESLNSKIGGK